MEVIEIKQIRSIEEMTDLNIIRQLHHISQVWTF